MTTPDTHLRILVTGWRHWPVSHRKVVWHALDAVRAGVLSSAYVRPHGRLITMPARPDWLDRPVIVRHGQCPYGGADLHADRWALERGFRVDRHPMDGFAGTAAGWRAAGVLRNTWMVEHGPKPDVCLAFPGPGSRGTWDCVRKAAAFGIEVVVIGFSDPIDLATIDKHAIRWPPSNVEELTLND